MFNEFAVQNGILERYTGTDTVVAIPDHVTEIGRSAFFQCGHITEVIIPENVRIIGDLAFADCTGLAQVVIADRSTVIGNDAFKGCPDPQIIYGSQHSLDIQRWQEEPFFGVFRHKAYWQLIQAAKIHLSHIRRWMRKKYPDEKIDLLLWSAVLTGTQTDGAFTEKQKQFISEVFENSFEGNLLRTIVNGAGQSRNTEALLLGMADISFHTALSLLKFILCFAYAEGEPGEQLKNKLKALFRLEILNDFTDDREYTIYSPDAVLCTLEYTIAEYIKNQKQPSSLTDLIRLFRSDETWYDFRHSLRHLAFLNVIYSNKTKHSIHYEPTGLPFVPDPNENTSFKNVAVDDTLIVPIPEDMYYFNGTLRTENGLLYLTAYPKDSDHSRIDSIRNAAAADKCITAAYVKDVTASFSDFYSVLDIRDEFAEDLKALRQYENGVYVTDSLVIRYYFINDHLAEIYAIADNGMYLIRYYMNSPDTTREELRKNVQFLAKGLKRTGIVVNPRKASVHNSLSEEEQRNVSEYIAVIRGIRKFREELLSRAVRINEEILKRNTEERWKPILEKKAGQYETMLSAVEDTPESSADLSQTLALIRESQDAYAKALSEYHRETEQNRSIVQEYSLFHRQIICDKVSSPYAYVPAITMGTHGGHWDILDPDPQTNTVLVISEEPVLMQEYSLLPEADSWDTWMLRDWLNDDFYETEFSEQEKEAVTALSPEYGDEPDDRIFLLSEEEAEEFFPSDYARILKSSGWLLRSHKRNRTGYVTVNIYGEIDNWTRGKGSVYVHPSLRLDLSSELCRPFLPDPAVQERSYDASLRQYRTLERAINEKAINGIHRDSLFLFGKKRRMWRVLASDPDTESALVISLKPVAFRPYDESAKRPDWKDCSLRRWLNEDFFETEFTGEEKDSILSVRLTTKNMTNEEETETEDRIFLIDRDEASGSDYQMLYPGNGSRWWIRYLCEDRKNVGVVSEKGHVIYSGEPYQTEMGVCPAFRLDLRSFASSQVILLKDPEAK